MSLTTSPITHYLVVDLEATCDQPASFPRSETEIIEIGAVLVDATSLHIEREFQTFVRPRRHPHLTAFCTQLTTITQDQVDGAPRFPDALDQLTRFVHGDVVLLSSWGRYDWNQLRRDAAYHRIAVPFQRHFNIKEAFSEALGTGRRFGTQAALRRVGLRFSGTHHRGIDDARNIARLLPWAIGRKTLTDEHPQPSRRGAHRRQRPHGKGRP